jgi:nicotinate-nucleotide adenylyltransferase
VRIGVLGGTFNPPHLGHLLCAQEAYVQLGLDTVMLIPARIPPHKPVEEEPGVEHRLELCRRVARDDPRFEVSDLEADRTGPSYTVDTLSELHLNAPDNDLFLIVGGDIAAGFADWHQPERVLSLATLAVAERRGTPSGAIDAALSHLQGADATRFFRMPRIDISSTLVRERVRARLPIRYLVPRPVEDYVAEKGLYC